MKYILAFLLLLGTRTALAVDGQILISQASIAASGGFPYKITKAGSYKLSGNLVGPLNNTVILISASHVNLDLNGFNVQCNWNSTAPFGLQSCITDNFAGGLTDISILNGSITAFATAPAYVLGQYVIGLELRSGGSLIEGIRFDSGGSNYAYNGLAVGAGSIVRKNIFTNQASPGLGCPSLIEDNVNTTLGAGGNGTGCKYVNNVGVFPTL